MKRYADKRRIMKEFDIGDWVYLKLRPHRQQSVVRRIHQKLAPRYYGPYRIVEKLGTVTYKLQLPPSSRIHPVFHISQLKQAMGSQEANMELPKELEATDEEVILPEKVLARRDWVKGAHIEKQVLVQWKGGTAEDATWENETHLCSQFPQLSLEDKTVLPDGGSGRTPSIESIKSPMQQRPKIWRVYTRRGKGGQPRES